MRQNVTHFFFLSSQWPLFNMGHSKEKMKIFTYTSPKKNKVITCMFQVVHMLTLSTSSLFRGPLEPPYELITSLRMYIMRGFCNPSPMLPKVPKNINNLSNESAYLNIPISKTTLST
ncbi:LOW QUALITY PROTEIN: hypothetical protein PanWU01x14_145810 [Parasponia andersonii]|uniref:Uncharacterized protein n=1 Tax=Parasponia andersonii TaxID=3476 RepID=A0A2P5CK94_PARAD|nr:LOW QUALITY PROTEIN: hypothetical protein PanWU01x14_145810 [Parasponia andersonii]